MFYTDMDLRRVVLRRHLHARGVRPAHPGGGGERHRGLAAVPGGLAGLPVPLGRGRRRRKRRAARPAGRRQVDAGQRGGVRGEPGQHHVVLG